VLADFRTDWGSVQARELRDGLAALERVGQRIEHQDAQVGERLRALAPIFLANPELPHRMRVIAFTILTPFYFLKAGSLVDFGTLLTSAGLILTFLGLKMATKFFGILPLTRAFRFETREGMYTTLLMSTGLTFGTISALFGLTNGIIDQRQYTVLVTAVIGSAVVPTLIAQRWFVPKLKPMGDEAVSVPDNASVKESKDV